MGVGSWLWPQNQGSSSGRPGATADSPATNHAGPAGGLTLDPGPTSADNQAGVVPPAIPRTDPTTVVPNQPRPAPATTTAAGGPAPPNQQPGGGGAEQETAGDLQPAAEPGDPTSVRSVGATTAEIDIAAWQGWLVASTG